MSGPAASRPGRHGLDQMLVQLDGRVAARDRLLGVAGDEIGLAVAQQARIGRNAIPGGAAEQAMEGHALRLAGNVPQRDVDAGKRETDRPVPAHGVKLALQVRHERRHVGEFAPDAQRRHDARDRLPRQRRSGKAERLAPAGEAGIGVDAHEQGLHVRPRPERPHLLGAAVLIGHGDEDGFDFRDFHCSTPACGRCTEWRATAPRATRRAYRPHSEIK